MLDCDINVNSLLFYIRKNRTIMDMNIILYIEDVMEALLRDSETKIRSTELLSKVGIDTNLETILSVVCGITIGQVLALSQLHYGDVNYVDVEDALELLNIRLLDLRQKMCTSV